MALSQKHPGLMNVPWFNREEWNHVYRLLQNYTDSSNLKETQEILEMWITRTPNIQPEVEGTLILLQPLLHDNPSCSKFVIQALYGMTLNRFLNLCFASGDKQGTFSERVMACGIPKWIVDIRYDMLYQHNLPKPTKLKNAVDFCFKWVLKNYWEKQHKALVSEYSVICLTARTIETAMELFRQINALNYQEKGSLTLETMESSNPSLKKKLLRWTQIAKIEMGSRIDTVLQILLQYVTNNYVNIPHEQLKEIVRRMVLSSEEFFFVHEPHNLENDEVYELPVNYVQAWTGLIDALFETQLIVYFLKVMLDICGMYKRVKQKVASLWIFNVLQRLLLTLLDKNDPEHHELFRRYPSLNELQSFTFCNINNRVFEEIKELRVAVIQNPKKWKLLFLNSFLHVCQYPNSYIAESVAVIELFLNPKVNNIDLQTVSEDQDDHSPKSDCFDLLGDSFNE